MSVSFAVGFKVARDKLTTNFGFPGHSDDLPFYDWGGCVRMEWWRFEDQVWE